MKKPLILMILDGFGISLDAGNAIVSAKTPNLGKIFGENPVTKIGASGMDVGLPDGQMGNSEVGHTNIGAGRVVYQELTRITKSIEDGDFFQNEALTKAIEKTKELVNQGKNAVFSVFETIEEAKQYADKTGVKELLVVGE